MGLRDGLYRGNLITVVVTYALLQPVGREPIRVAVVGGYRKASTAMLPVLCGASLTYRDALRTLICSFQVRFGWVRYSVSEIATYDGALSCMTGQFWRGPFPDSP